MMATDPHKNRRIRMRQRLERQLNAIERGLPWLRRPLKVIRARGWWIVRLPVALFFLFGGLLAVLPFLGLWMLPIGLLLLAIDLPLLRGPVSNAVVRGRRRIALWRRRRR